MPLTSFVAGVCTATAGAWTASKFHVYHEALTRHHNELKQHVLEPIRNLLQSKYSTPEVSVEWNKKQYNAHALAEEDPVVYGPLVQTSDPGLVAYETIEKALLHDARNRHYSDLISSWERFRDSWTAHLGERREWIETLSQEILARSGLPVVASGANDYIYPVTLGQFVYRRSMGLSALTLKPTFGQISQIVDDGRTTYASSGKPDQIQNLHDLINAMLRSEQGRAAKLTADLARLLSDRESLEGRFSDALSTKTLPHVGCPYVSFRSMLLRL